MIGQSFLNILTGIGACSKRVICKKSWRRETGFSPPVKYFSGRSKAVLLLWNICVFVSCVSLAFASVHCLLPCGHLLGKG